MKKIVFAVLTFVTIGAYSAAAQEQRIAATVTPVSYFQGRLERLYKAIDAKDQSSISRHERDLLGAMRDAIYAKGTPEEGTVAAKFKKEMEAILQKFDSFTFINAPKDETDSHLELLESFLAMMMN